MLRSKRDRYSEQNIMCMHIYIIYSSRELSGEFYEAKPSAIFVTSLSPELYVLYKRSDSALRVFYGIYTY